MFRKSVKAYMPSRGSIPGYEQRSAAHSEQTTTTVKLIYDGTATVFPAMISMLTIQ